MGILRKGIFDGFENKTGGLVGKRINGKNVICARQHKPVKPRSQLQIDQKVKFKLVLQFLSRFKGFIKVGFRNVKSNGTAFNAAVRFNFERLITGTGPGYAIDYTKLRYSRGCLAGPNSPAVIAGIDSILANWVPDRQSYFNRDTDKASFLVCCPDKNVTLKYPDKALRAELEAVLQLPPGLSGYAKYVFMHFVSADGKEVSDSKYLGMV